ncbi:hypothetical protein GCM10022243_51820 [Saccharothrix violaceirubra]|uniref:Uncharacterized protein n=1 Tax=Saccharothrix violaceirubra TaxID=413306 RepID=A0A7W7TAF8_9PSEU|nr:hypothetical protein [Saccharothrix violaceirubra]MBB4969517.1 hypothetical protein [Saccharothrix violaceirubra]
MRDVDLRTALHAAFDDEPPLDFDPDVLMDRAKRGRTRRMALFAVVVLTLMACGSYLALPRLLANDRSGDVRVLGSGNLVPIPLIEEHVSARIAMAIPGARDVTVSISGTGLGPEDQLDLAIRFTDDLGVASAAMHIAGLDRGFSRGSFCAKYGCVRTLDQPDGSVVELAEKRDATVRRSAAHFRKSGIIVLAVAYAYDVTDGSDHRPSEPSLSFDVLVALATDPDLAQG